MVRNYFLILKNHTVVDSQLVFIGAANNIQTIDKDYCMAIDDGRKILHLHHIQTSPIRYQIDTIILKKPTLYYHSSKNTLYANTNDGGVDAYDIHSHQYLFSFQGDFVINSVYEDKHGDYWVATRNSGLLYYRKSILQDIPSVSSYDNHAVYSFCIPDQGDRYYVGLNDNSVLEFNHSKIKEYQLDSIKNPGMVHYLLPVRNKLYAFSEHASTLNFKSHFSKPFNERKVINYKCVRLLSDSNLLLCGQGRLDWLDTRNDSLHIHFQNFILNTCAAADKRMVFTGSTDGLRIVLNFTQVIKPSGQDSILKERITDLSLSKESMLWVATSQAGIYAYKNDKVYWKIGTKQGLINDMTNRIYVDSKNQIWVGTNTGLSRLQQNPNGSFSIQNITQLDGLASNDINQFYEWHDTMFVVTSRGVTRMPLTIRFPASDIPVVLQGVSVNQNRFPIQQSYQLPYDQNEISFQFSGVDITGHFKQLEYTLNASDNWTLLEGNTLNLNLNSGLHEIRVRSVDVNGNRGKEALQITVLVSTPFWKSAWFWIICISFSQIVLGYFFYKRIKHKQREKMQRDRTRIELASLEQQAFTSLLNPHFIFNALNGLQDFINKGDRQHTNRYLSKLSSLIRKSFELAQQSFVSLDEEILNLKQYLDLEQQRHLPSFRYEINIAPDIDPEDVMLPSMLLQPLVENALIHGKLSADPNGLLSIHVNRYDLGIRYRIRDNGIGLEQSAALVSEQRRHKSRGLQLLQKRLEALGELCRKPIGFVYRVPFPNQALKPGHEVDFTLPFELYTIWQQSKKGNTSE